MLRLVSAALWCAALCAEPGFAEQRPPAFYPLLKSNYTYAIPTGDGTLTVAMSVPSVLPIDIDDGHSPITQPVFATFTLAKEKSRASLELDLPTRAADPVASRFQDPSAVVFIESFARAIMAVSACQGGEIGVQSLTGRYRLDVASRSAGTSEASPLALQSFSRMPLPVRMESRTGKFTVWKADMTCSFWRNPAAARQIARMHEGLDSRTRDPLERIRAARIWETARHHSFGVLPKRPGRTVGPRWGDPDAAGIYVATIPGVPREPGVLRPAPRANTAIRAQVRQTPRR